MDEATQHISVSLLISDLNEGKRITQVFKEIGIVPHIWRSEMEFLESCEEEKPHFAIVDVRKMSDYFFEHDLVKNNELALSFFYQLSSKSLLNKTYSIFNYGYINAHQSLKGQIKSILSRFNHVDSFRTKAKQVSQSQESYEEKLDKIVRQVQQLKEKEFYHSLQKSICNRLETEKRADDFYTATARVFSTVKEIHSFTFLELSSSGHKLLSPKLYFDKYKEIPSLWLGRSCSKGIEFFAQNMASQVCLELIGGDLMSLLIRGKNEEPDLMLFLKVEDEDFINHFDWESFELYLSGFYSYFRLRDSVTGDSRSEQTSPWGLFSMVDELGNGAILNSQFEGSRDRFSLLSVDFSVLLVKTFGNLKERFYWQKFYQDFFNGFEAQKKFSFKVFCYGLSYSVLQVNRDEEELVKKELERYCKKFPYWRYFEQSDMLLTQDFSPEVNYLPMSLNALLAALDGRVREEEPVSLLRESSPQMDM